MPYENEALVQLNTYILSIIIELLDLSLSISMWFWKPETMTNLKNVFDLNSVKPEQWHVILSQAPSVTGQDHLTKTNKMLSKIKLDDGFNVFEWWHKDDDKNRNNWEEKMNQRIKERKNKDNYVFQLICISLRQREEQFD